MSKGNADELSRLFKLEKDRFCADYANGIEIKLSPDEILLATSSFQNTIKNARLSRDNNVMLMQLCARMLNRVELGPTLRQIVDSGFPHRLRRQ